MLTYMLQFILVCFSLSTEEKIWSAVLIDSRFDSAVVASIANARHHIPSHVIIHVITHSKNWPRAKKALYGMQNCHIVNFSYESSSIDDYNKLLTSKFLWNMFLDDYILVFQRDSRFCSYSHRRIENFVGKFDFIGAPWNIVYMGVQVGNGGFSLRSRSAMLNCIENNILPANVNEDIAMSACIRNLGLSLPSLEIASEFAVETIRYSNITPLAVHKSWKYITDDDQLARYCPESVLI